MKIEPQVKTFHMDPKTKSENGVGKYSMTGISPVIYNSIQENIQYYRSVPDREIDDRIDQLNKEWDIERTLQTSAPLITLSGCLLAIVSKKSWTILPILFSSVLAQQALKGWSLPVPLLRKLGLRTRNEIDTEKYALKAIRGDFNHLIKETRKTVW